MTDLTKLNLANIWRLGKLPCEIYEEWSAKPGWQRWCDTDSEERYHRRGNKEFSVEDVSYQINSHGYRCKDFGDINHNAFKVMTAGCSETFGIGLPQHFTFSEQLGALIRQTYDDMEVEVLNMGAGGRSSDYIVRLLYQSLNILRPNYVFCLLPDMQRREYIVQYQYLTPVSFGTRDHKDTFTKETYDEAFLTLSTDPWDFFSMVKNLAMIELILRDVCWSWDTWMREAWKLPGFESYFDMSHYRNQDIRIVDRGRARDNIHNGIPYHTAIAHDVMGDPYLTQAIDLYRHDQGLPTTSS